MKRGYLSQYFRGIAAKKLSPVEVDAVRSNQHELNGDRNLRELLGECGASRTFGAKFIYLADHDASPVLDSAYLTWYDARQKARIERGVNRRECRLYFPDTVVSACAAPGDLLVLARMQDDTLLAVIAEGGSTIEQQLQWLFGFSDLIHPGFSVKAETESDQVKIDFAARLILEQIGVEVEDQDSSYLEVMLDRFSGRFPGTRQFSEFARSTIADLSAGDDADTALITWMDREEILFRTLERHLIAEKLREGFGEDVDGFIQFSLSVQNRRKSRAGSALEHHFAEILRVRGIQFERAAQTENRSKPDFLFPSGISYHDPKFPVDRLTVLGVKSSCKDRWRQVLAEANRVRKKHLLTLEPGISSNQTDEMKQRNLQLVLPRKLHESYTSIQQSWLLTVSEFLKVVQERQAV
jgi:hypothetical protein